MQVLSVFFCHSLQYDKRTDIGADARTAQMLQQPGYVQSKWVAEKLLMKAADMDPNLRVLLLRPGNVRPVPFSSCVCTLVWACALVCLCALVCFCLWLTLPVCPPCVCS